MLNWRVSDSSFFASRSEHDLHQSACGRVVNRLGRGAQGNAERFQVGTQRKVVVLLTSESREVEDDELHPAFVRPAELQELV
jgi:hypothetical protein